MPAALYAFSLCAFALGFTEFVVIGLSSAMAADLGRSSADLGAAITAYAIGVAIGAPILTALAANLARKTVLMAAMAVFVLGNLMIAATGSLEVILAGRFITGLSHGVFLAIAASVATALVAPDRAARAIALVFGGLTLALVLGVPIGTYLGAVWSWRAVFVAAAVCATIAMVGLQIWTPRGTGDVGPRSELEGLRVLTSPPLLRATLVTVLAYCAAFVLFTYMTPFLSDVTGLGIGQISTVLLLFGLAAAAGNAAGGIVSDRIGNHRATISAIIVLGLLLCGIGAMSAQPLATALLVCGLGAAMFAAVPILQARVLDVAAIHAPDAVASASGLNIAGFNLGIAVGSAVGGVAIAQIGLSATPLIGAAFAGAALGLTLLSPSAVAAATR